MISGVYGVACVPSAVLGGGDVRTNRTSPPPPWDMQSLVEDRCETNDATCIN